MTDRLVRMLEPILRDVATCAELALRVQDGYRPSAPPGVPVDDDWLMVWTPDSAGTGIALRGGEDELEQLADVFDQVHEVAVEGRGNAGLSTSWPPCPAHPERRPLSVALRGTQTLWACPVDGQVHCEVGQLAC